HRPGEKNVIPDRLSRQRAEVDLDTVRTRARQKDNDHPATPETEEEGVPYPSKPTRQRLIERAHAFGHFGRDAVVERLLADGRYWPKLKQEVQDVIRACPACARHTMGRKRYAPRRPVIATLPWDHIAIDLITPLPTTTEGHTAMLVCTDLFTRYTVLEPLKSKSASELARKLWHIMAS